MHLLSQFREIWALDTEYGGKPGDVPAVACLVGKELRTGRTLRLWGSALNRPSPFGTGLDTLIIAYAANAELVSYLSLGWPLPHMVLDLYAEFKCLTNERRKEFRNGFYDALDMYGISHLDRLVKKAAQLEIAQGPPWKADRIEGYVKYCATDVIALEQLFYKMLPHLDLRRALLRGAYMPAVAQMEFRGIPVNMERVRQLRENWTTLRKHLAAKVGAEFGDIYSSDLKFCYANFANWVRQNFQNWPLTE